MGLMLGALAYGITEVLDRGMPIRIELILVQLVKDLLLIIFTEGKLNESLLFIECSFNMDLCHQ